MKTIEEFFKERWCEKLGIEFVESETLPDLNSLGKSEWDEEFEDLRRNRMVMGAFRYGLISRQNLSQYNFTKETKRRLTLFECDNNLEHLLDAGNMCMLAYIKAKRSDCILKSIDDGEHNKPEEDV